MERRLLSTVLILWRVAGAGYLMWCDHRVSMPVLMHDAPWPRPFPYPDDWLADWAGRIDAERGFIRCCDSYELPGRIRKWILSALVVSTFGVATLLWTPGGRRRSRWLSVRRGVAIGLVLGVSWAAILGHAEREGISSVWPQLVLWGFSFAVVGAAVGTVRHFPELVGFGTGPLAVVMSLHFIERWDRNHAFGGQYPKTVLEFVASLAGLNRPPGDVAIFVIYALFWGLVIGALHRLCRSGLACASRFRRDLARQ